MSQKSLPIASVPTKRQSIVRAALCTMVPVALVEAANSKSVPTAVVGWTPNSKMSSGVNNEPPPTPVMPTRAPTQKPDAA